MKPKFIVAALLIALLGGCAFPGGNAGEGGAEALKQSDRLIKDGRPEESIEVLEAAHRARPDDVEVNVVLQNRKNTYVSGELRAAGVAWAMGDEDTAFERLENASRADPSNQRVRQAIDRLHQRVQFRSELERAQRLRQQSPDQALEIVRRILDEQPDYADAIQLRDNLQRQLQRDRAMQPRLAEALRKPVTLNFRSQPLENIFDAISRATGLNFVFDQEVQLSEPASLFAKSTTAEDAIRLLLRANQLTKKVLDEHTLLIYPSRPDKGRTYKEFMMRTFFLSHADAKNVVAALRQMVKPRDIYVDERTNAVIVRDTPESVKVAERLVQALDLPQSEVTMDVQVLEVNADDAVDFGVQYPEELGFSIEHPYERVHTTIGDLLSLNRDNIAVSGDKGAKLRMAIRMLQKQGKTKILANPKIRVRNNEKADINVGERVPVVTTTTNNGVTSESIAHQDVGLQLVVQPRISLHDEVSVKVTLEVSNILQEIATKTGLIAYKLGTRKAQTLLTARDNETQVLAGLINRNVTSSSSGLPYLSGLPGIGRAFGTDRSGSVRSEIVLLITPHIERNLDLPASAVTTFMSGTEGELTTEPMAFGRVPEKGAVPAGAPGLSDPIDGRPGDARTGGAALKLPPNGGAPTSQEEPTVPDKGEGKADKGRAAVSAEEKTSGR